MDDMQQDSTAATLPEITDATTHALTTERSGAPHPQSRPLNSRPELLFDTIASQADLLRTLLANLRRQPERHRDLDVVFADLCLAEVLANQIGALADQMVGGRVVGSLASWVVGPGFDASGDHAQGTTI
jgi:hypothetical protein